MTGFNASRRRLLQHTGAVLGSSAAPLALNMMAMGSAAAQSATDYKALVCVFQFGGNDPFNTVLATDPGSWSNYVAVRNQAPDSIALMAPGVAAVPGAAVGSPARLGGVLPISPLRSQSRTYALHPVLAVLQAKFNTDRKLAIAVCP